MDLRTGSPRIRRGTYFEIDMTATYEVKRLPRQIDQRRQWFNPVDPYGGIALAAEEVDAFDGSRGGFGGMEFPWLMTMMTPLMVAFLRDDPTMFNGERSAAFTVMTWDRGYGWRFINATAIWNEPAKSAELPGGMPGYDNVRIDFIDGVIADDGRQHSKAHSSDFA